MSRIAYVNGRFVPHQSASIHIEDRGYQFADGIYEVCEIRNGCLIDREGHLDRLERSMRELQIKPPMSRQSLCLVMREVKRRNHVTNGLVYLQVTRGVAPRNHLFPAQNTPSSIVVTARSLAFAKTDQLATKGVSVITVPDNRWERVDIKTISLLPNVLAKEKARQAGASEAWFVDSDGYITEGASTNAWIVTTDNVLVTRDASRGILKGITREGILRMAEKLQIRVEERRFSIAEAKAAKEAFLTAATLLVMPVVAIDGEKIGSGTAGPIAHRLRHEFHDHADKAF